VTDERKEVSQTISTSEREMETGAETAAAAEIEGGRGHNAVTHNAGRQTK